MEGLQHIICIHLFLKWYMFFKYCICVTNDIWFYTFKSYQRLGEAAKWNTNVDKGHPLIFYHDPGKHTEGSVTMYHQVGSKGFMKALSASFRSYRQRLIFLMLKRRSFLRGWRPFSVASISGNPHSQCPWLFRPADRVMPQTEAWENLWFLMFLSRFWSTSLNVYWLKTTKAQPRVWSNWLSEKRACAEGLFAGEVGLVGFWNQGTLEELVFIWFEGFLLSFGFLDSKGS